MTPRAHRDFARCAGIHDAVERICIVLDSEPPERWLASLGTTVGLVIRCAEPDQRMPLVDRWCELLRTQVAIGLREDAN